MKDTILLRVQVLGEQQDTICIVYDDTNIYISKTHIKNWVENMPWYRVQKEARDGKIDIVLPKWFATQRGLV